MTPGLAPRGAQGKRDPVGAGEEDHAAQEPAAAACQHVAGNRAKKALEQKRVPFDRPARECAGHRGGDDAREPTSERSVPMAPRLPNLPRIPRGAVTPESQQDSRHVF